jgi:hypothetical protein
MTMTNRQHMHCLRGTSATLFDLDDPEAEERFLDWLCHHLYLRNESVRHLVDWRAASTILIFLRPDALFDPTGTRLFVTVSNRVIHVTDEWASTAEPSEARDIFRDFGFSTEERARAEERAREKALEDDGSS